MKYPSSILGIIAFATAMIWSWSIIHADTGVSFETHSGIQEKLSALILDTIKAKVPTASAVQIERLWTENISPDKIKASFSYSYRDAGESGPTISSIKGEAFLDRQPEDDSGEDRWSLSKVKTSADAVIFEEGLVVTPDSE